MRRNTAGVTALDATVIREQLVFARSVLSPGERAAIAADVRRERLLRIRRGVYIASELWIRLSAEDQHRVRVIAASELERLGEPTGDPFVASHVSAVALWRLPWAGAYPARVHVVSEHARGGRSNSHIVRHTSGRPAAPVLIDGVLVTDLASTVVAVAVSESFREAVIVADAALRRAEHPIEHMPAGITDRAGLLTVADALPLRQGSAAARAVGEFADGRADRPGESHSRVSMHEAGITPPKLQVELFGASGRRYFGDFWWPQFQTIGEFDGEGKYRDPKFLRGRTPHRALMDEKAREDDLRATGRRFVRWGWPIALSPTRLRAHLLRGGVT